MAYSGRFGNRPVPVGDGPVPGLLGELPGFDVRIGLVLLAPRGTPDAEAADWAALVRGVLAEAPTAAAPNASAGPTPGNSAG